MAKKKQRNRPYPHIMPEITDWPIYKLHQDRRNLIEEMDAFTLERLQSRYGGELSSVIAKTIYMERIRIKEDPWKVDPPDERTFWNKIQSKLKEKSLDKSAEEAKSVNLGLLQRIIHRYSEEVVGTFKVKTFLFARKFLTFFFSRLLNTSQGMLFRNRYQLYDRLRAVGELETIRSLMAKGTVVVLPTHSSNLDSILVGYVMDSVIGLPSFSYGAGLNLYNTGYTAYYMNRIGAYRVDRRKKNPIYLEVLKSFSNLAIQRGTNSLFFLGGTRSRSGAIENRLKKGLLGTVVEAQRALYQRDEDRKVFVVPVVLCYHAVLEAKPLIDQWLHRTGKELYISSRDKFSIRKMIRFAWSIWSKGSSITLSFGKPMDVLGNFVDGEGVSYDQFGKPVEVKDYFRSDGVVQTDLQRDREYTRILTERMEERYYVENVVLSSHLVAFTAFELLRHQNKELDIYGTLRLPPEDFEFSREQLLVYVSRMQEHLIEMEQRGEIRLSETIYKNAEELLEDGISNLGIYHAYKPLCYTRRGRRLISQDFKLLFFYHNRLDNYGFEQILTEEAVQKQVAELVEK